MQEIIIKNVRRHIDPTGEEITIFLSLAVAKTVKRKEFLLKEGDVARHQFFVVNGCLRTYTIDAGGKEHILMFAPEDWWCSGDLYDDVAYSRSAIYIPSLLYIPSSRPSP